uniref:Uncharacterized protein n=1 Tax=Triticum urartu TaxID=4572 RepID=A0A8R7U563_TRIUA
TTCSVGGNGDSFWPDRGAEASRNSAHLVVTELAAEAWSILRSLLWQLGSCMLLPHTCQ